MSLQNNIYARLFPHLQPPLAEPVPVMAESRGRQSNEEIENVGFEAEPANDPPAKVQPATQTSPFDYEPPVPHMQFGAEDFANAVRGKAGGDDLPAANNPGTPLSPYDQAKMDYMNAAAAEKPKVDGWKNALVIGMQAAQKFFSPNDASPIKTASELKHEQKVERAARILAPLQKQRDNDLNEEYKRTQIENVKDDNEQRRQDSVNRREHQKEQSAQKKAEYEGRQLNAKMRTASQMWGKTQGYDPTKPRFEQLTKFLGDVGLPLTPNDAKKNVRLVQDAETGAWTLSLVDTATGEQEIRPVLNKDGSQLSTTSSSKVMAEAAGERQENQQRFTAGENDKRRRFEERMKGITTENEAIRTINSEISEGQKRVANKELSEEKFKAGIIEMINMFNEPLRAKLLERYGKQ